MPLNEPPFANEYSGSVPPGLGLNPRYTFEAFIVGSSNRLAHAASLAVAEKPGVSYNPLFLYGGVGLGKTHLLHAIGQTAVENGLVVLYISSETFTNDIVNAIRYRSTEEFRAKYRSVDILLVDDIQFIAGKESTEEEFFHTFNSLYEASKQIVICSDRPPKSIAGLEERLRSRFEWGLIADIQPPDLELRIAILRSKVDLMQRVVPNDVIDFVARRVDTNIRELEGSLNRVLVYAELTNNELTVEVAREALQNLDIDFSGNQPSLQQIVRAVADYYHVPEVDLRGKQRERRVVLPRQVAMFLMHTETDASSTDIGRELGGRDHTTAIHGYEKITEEIKENTTLKREIEAIRLMLYR
jgi:chromosomal replication initiator protein